MPNIHHDNQRRADALAGSIATRLGMCSLDELRVFDVILERVLKLGRESYAPLDLARDERDWSAEAAAELADTLFYLAAREVSANDRRLERLRCEAADEIHAKIEIGLTELRDSKPVIRATTAIEWPGLVELDECGGKG